MNKKTINDIDVKNKRAFVRVDFNVPLDKKTNAISSDARIRAAVPTIQHLMQQQAKVILCSHLGRPKGIDPTQSLRPVANRLGQLLGKLVAFAEDCVGPKAQQAVAALKPGEVLVLENVRFHAEEEKNDPKFAEALASLADVYVDDAFGYAHRAHASTEGIAKRLPAVAGFLMEKELRYFDKVLEHPDRPLAAILGGAKVSDKIAVLENLVQRVDAILIGGGMAATFLVAKGYDVGKSLLEKDKVDYARQVMERSVKRGVRFLLPLDVVAAAAFDANADARTLPVGRIPSEWMIMDIGPLTIASYQEELERCKTVVWNGPMGVFEFPRFAEGTKAIARTLAGLEATTILGGGSTAEAVEQLGLESKMTHVSTGGGASLELLEGKKLPGVEALLDK